MGASQTATRWRAVWALRLESCPTERLKMDSEITVLTRRLREGRELLRGLVAVRAGDLAPSFALRTIVSPDEASFTAGRLEVVLLAQAASRTKSAAKAEAASLFHEVAALLGGAFPDHIWQRVEDEAQFQSLWQPLEPTYLAEIRRRESVIELPPLFCQPTIGQRGKARGEAASSPVRVVHPFLPHPVGLGQLLRTFLLHPTPLVWQTTISAARLTGAETAEMRAQIARCERPQHQRQAHSSAFAPASQWPELLANGAARALGEQLARLSSAPTLLNVALWSEAPLPPALVEACGAALSAAYASGSEDATDSPLAAGGFRADWPAAAAQMRAARRNATQLEFAHWGNGDWPDALQRLTYLADAEEAAGAFRLPFAQESGLPGMKVRAARLRPVPGTVAALAKCNDSALALGVNRYLGGQQPVFLGETDRQQHVYVAGQTGTGKSTLLKSMALADIEAGRGVAVIDPHGDLFEELLALVPAHRREDVVVLDPMDKTDPVGLNLLECRDEDERYFVVRELRAIMERLLGDQFQGQQSQFTGPIFYRHMQMNMLLAMSDPDNPGTLLDFYEIFQQPNYWKRWLPLRWSDSRLRSWVEHSLPTTKYQHYGDSSVTLGEYISSKFEDFLFDPALRLIFGQQRSTLDLRAIMDEGKILLVNLAKGHLSESNSRFLGMVLMAKIQGAAMSRIKMPASQRRPFSLYVDEFQALATENFTLMLSESRKFGLGLTLANQFVAQIDPHIGQAIFGNAGTVIAFRAGRADAEALAPLFQPSFDADDLTNLPNWQACVKTTVGGQIAAPFSLQTVLPAATPDPQTAHEVRTISAAFYGRVRAQVETEIMRSSQFKRVASPRIQNARQKLVTVLARRAQKMPAVAPPAPRASYRSNPRFHTHFAALPKAEQRNCSVPTGQQFRLDNPDLPDSERFLQTLDELSEAINLIDPATFKRHVSSDRNDFADWIERVFGTAELADMLRRYPTPLRIMVSIEKYLRSTTNSKPDADKIARDRPSFLDCVEAMTPEK